MNRMREGRATNSRVKIHTASDRGTFTWSNANRKKKREKLILLYDNDGIGTNTDTKMKKNQSKTLQKITERKTIIHWYKQQHTNKSLPLKWWKNFKIRVTMVVDFLFYNIVVVIVAVIFLL